MAGPQSINFVSIPLIAWALQHFTRASVQAYGEQVGSLPDTAKEAILTALIITAAYLTASNSQDHSWYIRDRRYYFTAPPSEVVWVPAYRYCPWDKRWAKVTKHGQTTMTSSWRYDTEKHRTSVFQANPLHMLGDIRWKEWTENQISDYVKR